MSYHMRREDREIADWSVMEEVLRQGKYATLALCRDHEPYVFTLNYGYDAVERALYFPLRLRGAEG